MKFAPALTYATRGLLREPLVSVIVIVLLGFGIAANATIFEIIDQVLIKSLPYTDPGRLVMVWESNPNQPEPAGSHIPAARENFDWWRQQARSFEAIEAYQRSSVDLTGVRNPEHLDTGKCTAGFFKMLGVRSALGRTFLPEDQIPGRDRVLLLSHGFWAHHFAGLNPVGRVLLLDGDPYTVIGVLPQDFHLPNIFQGLFEDKPQVWTPLPQISSKDAALLKRRSLLVYGRLKINVSLAQARAELRSLAAERAREDPELDSGYSVNAFSLRYENTDPVLRRALYFLWLSVGFVLLLVCVTVCGLTLLRAVRRQKDTAIMAALGAQRNRLMMSAMVPMLVLAGISVLVGLLGAYAGIALVKALEPADIHGIERIALNTDGIAITMLILAVILCLVGLIPAWASCRGDLGKGLKQHGARAATGKKTFRWFLIASVEIATALSLVIWAVLLVRSFHDLMRVNPGFNTRNILTAHVTLPARRYPSPDDQMRFCTRVLDGLRALPQVEAASLIDNMPLYAIRYAPFEIEGRPVLRTGDAPTADYAHITPEFFQTMGIALDEGRGFTESDVQDGAASVVVVNETLAQRLWPNENPIGQHLRSLGGDPGPWATVVGVVHDFVQSNIDTPPRPELFWPAKRMGDMTIVARTTGDASSLAPAFKVTIQNVDSEQPITDLQTLAHLLRHRTSQWRFNMWVVTFFAAFGVGLSLVGVYGLTSYFVTWRTREIGICLALGAEPRQISTSLFRRLLPFILLGVLGGIGTSLALGRFMGRLLFRISPHDLTTYSIAPLAIFVVVALAVWLPARKAAQTDPARVLRTE